MVAIKTRAALLYCVKGLLDSILRLETRLYSTTFWFRVDRYSTYSVWTASTCVVVDRPTRNRSADCGVFVSPCLSPKSTRYVSGHSVLYVAYIQTGPISLVPTTKIKNVFWIVENFIHWRFLWALKEKPTFPWRLFGDNKLKASNQ